MGVKMPYSYYEQSNCRIWLDNETIGTKKLAEEPGIVAGIVLTILG